MASTMTVRDIDLNKRADVLSTDEVDKIATVLNNSCQFKIPAHMLNLRQKRTRHHRSPRCHEQGITQQRDGLGG